METTAPHLSYADLKTALDRCMAAHPPVGGAHYMHEDANVMADLFVRMTLDRCTSIAAAEVKPDTAAAIARWLTPSD